MLISRALRLSLSTIADQQSSIAIVGAGGKTTSLFQLAHQLAPAIVTTTTHLGAWQTSQADRHFILTRANPDIETMLASGVTLVTGSLDGDRLGPVDKDILSWLRTFCGDHGLPLLIEADGAQGKPLKAPAGYEPVIPNFVDTVIVVAGLSGLGKPLTNETVHRPEIFAGLSALSMGETISPEAVISVLTHPNGGLKNIPVKARRVILLNQADTPELQSRAKGMAEKVLSACDSVLVASLGQNQIHAVHEPVAGIILAAGEAKRFGQPKQLIGYQGKPLVQHAVMRAFAAGLSPVVVVTGAYSEQVGAAVYDLSAAILFNPDWQQGQSSSIQTGLRSLSPKNGAAIFLLADQPQVTPTILRALVERHSVDLSPIVAPQVQGQRANPVLFDRITFPALMALTGDVGGRAIFSKYPVTVLPWHDENLLDDIDTPDDYRRLLHRE